MLEPRCREGRTATSPPSESCAGHSEREAPSPSQAGWIETFHSRRGKGGAEKEVVGSYRAERHWEFPSVRQVYTQGGSGWADTCGHHATAVGLREKGSAGVKVGQVDRRTLEVPVLKY